MKNYPFRRFYLTSLLLSVGWLCGCSHSTTTTAVNTFPSPITAVKLSGTSQFAHLEAGGLSILAVGDSLVNFDLVPNISVTNDSNIALHLFAIWQIGPMTTNSSTSEISLYDTVDLGIITPKATIPIDSIPIISLSEKLSAGITIPYNLGIGTLSGPLLASAGDVFDSVHFNSRYRGIIFTTESSPTPLAIYDAPDDGDWQGDSIFSPTATYPNPAILNAEAGFMVTEPLDSLIGEIMVTPHNIKNIFFNNHLNDLGGHEIMLDLSGFSPGLYRVLWTAIKNNTIITSHGDIMVPLH